MTDLVDIRRRGSPALDPALVIASLDMALDPAIDPASDPLLYAPRRWTDPAAARAEIRARLRMMEDGEPRDWTRQAASWALECAAGRADLRGGVLGVPCDDVALDARSAKGAELDALMRRWAEKMGEAAPGLLADQFPDPDDAEDLDPCEWADRGAAWLDRQESAEADAEAADLRALRAQEELRAPGVVSRLLLTLGRPDIILARLTWAWSVRAWWAALSNRRRKNPAALVLPFVAPLVQTLRAARWDGRRLVDAAGRPMPLVPTMPDLLPDLPGLGKLGSLTSHRLARWCVREGWERWIRDEPDPGRLSVEGGWAGLAQAMGAKSKKAADDVRDVVLTWEQTRVTWDGPGRSGALVLLAGHDLMPGAPGRQAHLTLFLSPMFLPGMVAQFPVKGRPALVPVLPLPPLVGGRQTYAAQAALQFAVLNELRLRAAELGSGGAWISPERWTEMARKAELPAALLPLVLARWTQDLDDGPAFLVRVGDRWTLADAHADVRAFLVAGGRRTTVARLSGRKAAARKTVEK